MNGKVHQVAGIVATEAVLITMQQPVMTVVTGIAILGGFFLGVAPDLDDSDATLAQQQPFRLGSLILERIPFVSHRGVTHSFLIVGLLYLLFSQIMALPDVLVWSFLAAYGSHIFLDLLTDGGVELLWPVRYRIKLLPSIMAVSSDERSIGQIVFHTVLSAAFYFMTIHLLISGLEFMPLVGQGLSGFWQSNILTHFPIEIQNWLNY
jgi:inner membrane protein